MSLRKSLDDIKRELAPLSKYWVVIYGSYARRDMDERSDIDVAVITRCNDSRKNSKLLYEILGKIPPYYDVKIFEEMPLYLKVRVFKEGIVLFGNPPEVTEYMYQFWKIWKDMERRVKENTFSNARERIRVLRKLRRIR